MTGTRKLRIGLALGSGSARGWAHIGVIKALEAIGIKPDVVCGTSIGALVGAAYVSGNLAHLEAWVRDLGFWDIVKLMDVKLEGGLIEGEDLMASFGERIKDVTIDQLPLPFAAVATELHSGREIWLQAGTLHQAVRASIALPGLFSPVHTDSGWLLDGGLVNPVPISLCRAMGAEFIIAVNLNSHIVGRRLKTAQPPAEEERDLFGQLMQQINSELLKRGLPSLSGKQNKTPTSPGLFEVVATTIHIMQDRITRSRMAGDPPDIHIRPHLAQLGLMEFDRAEEAITEGEASVQRLEHELRHALNL